MSGWAPFVGEAPWPHQVAAFEACREFLTTGGARGLVQMPTGTGKSRIIRALAMWAIAMRRPVVIAAPWQEILDQFADDLRRETRTPFYVDKAEQRRPATALIILASHATLWRRLHLYPPHSLLLFDECHHSGRPARCNLQSLARFDQVLGFSASPWSPECEEIYDGNVLYTYPLSRAVADGYVCPYVIEPMPEPVPAPQRFELYFCASNDQARQFAAANPQARYLGHETQSADRTKTLARFRLGEVRRLYLNRCLVEGFDCPQVDRVFIDKGTQSELMLYQMAGRGLRRKRAGRFFRLSCFDAGAVVRALERAG